MVTNRRGATELATQPRLASTLSSVLQSALGSLDVQLDEELARYRRQKAGHPAPPPKGLVRNPSRKVLDLMPLSGNGKAPSPQTPAAVTPKTPAPARPQAPPGHRIQPPFPPQPPAQTKVAPAVVPAAPVVASSSAATLAASLAAALSPAELAEPDLFLHETVEEAAMFGTDRFDTDMFGAETFGPAPSHAKPDLSSRAGTRDGELVKFSPVDLSAPPQETRDLQGTEPIAADPYDYLESSEELLRSLSEEEPDFLDEPSFITNLFTPIGIGSMLLLLLSSATIGYLFINPSSLQHLGLDRIFRPQLPTPATAQSPGQSNNGATTPLAPTATGGATGGSKGSTVAGLPNSPNLASQEFVDLNLNTLSNLKSATNATPPRVGSMPYGFALPTQGGTPSPTVANSPLPPGLANAMAPRTTVATNPGIRTVGLVPPSPTTIVVPRTGAPSVSTASVLGSSPPASPSVASFPSPSGMVIQAQPGIAAPPYIPAPGASTLPATLGNPQMLPAPVAMGSQPVDISRPIRVPVSVPGNYNPPIVSQPPSNVVMSRPSSVSGQAMVLPPPTLPAATQPTVSVPLGVPQTISAPPPGGSTSSAANSGGPRYEVSTPYTGDRAMESAQQVVPDAYLRNSTNGARIQLGTFDNETQAQQRARQLQQQGISAQVYPR